MDDEPTALTIMTDTPLSLGRERSRYGNDLARAGVAADHASRTDAFAEYHAEQTDNTRAAQRDALKCQVAAGAGVRHRHAQPPPLHHQAVLPPGAHGGCRC